MLLPFIGLGILTGCADEAEQGREWCRKAAKIAGSMCVEAEQGEDGDVFLSVYATSDVTNVNLSEIGGPASSSKDGSKESVQPGTGKVYWTSDFIQYELTITLEANSGSFGKYAILLKPPGGGGEKGESRTYKLFLSDNYYGLVNPDN